jgi:hypothetical protein
MGRGTCFGAMAGSRNNAEPHQASAHSKEHRISMPAT